MALHQQNPLHRHLYAYWFDALNEIDDILWRSDPTQREVGPEGTIFRGRSRCQHRRLDPRGKCDQLRRTLPKSHPQHRCLLGTGECAQPAPPDGKAITEVGLIERAEQTICLDLSDLSHKPQGQVPIRRIDPPARNRRTVECCDQSVAHFGSQGDGDEQTPQCHHSPLRASRSRCNAAVVA